MKKILLLTALVIASLQLTAANVDLATAKQSAQCFLMSKTDNGRFNASNPTIKWTHEEKNSSNIAQVAYYIVNTDRGFVIIAGDDRANEILAYGDKPLEGMNDLPDAMQFILNLYKAQMEYLQAHPGLVVKPSLKAGGTSVEPMLYTTWGQGKGYNAKCPTDGGNSRYCQVGCMAVSLAQVMRYWEYPPTAPAMDGYQTKTKKINVSALPEYDFVWDKMRNTYEGLSNSYIENILPDDEKNALGWLMRYAGQALHMDYAYDRSGSDNLDMVAALATFGFEGAQMVKKYDSPDFNGDTLKTGVEFYTDEQWSQIMQAELRAGRPLIYMANDMSSDSTGIVGHAFNIDGYDAENNLFHVNFGMSSDKNGFFALDNFTIDNGMTVYDFWPVLFTGVQDPNASTDPRIFATPQELSMECYTGETTTATFAVSGSNLTGNITVTVNDENGVFTADVATVTVEEAAENKTVTVTFAPQAVGTYSATITLSSEGAENKVVTLMGVATNVPLVVYAPVMLPADSAYINLTSFRADWTDQTAPQNVLNYTLDVKEKPGAGAELANVDWSTGSGSAASYLPEGWTYGDYSIYFDEGGIAISTDSYILTDVLDLSGCDKVTIVMRAKSYYSFASMPSKITVMTSIDEQQIVLPASYTDYTIVLNCNESDQVMFFADAYNPTIQSIKIYSGEVTAPELRATVTGDASHYVISGITDKFYTVENLNAEGTYLFKVKAHYTDGTESDWSNIETVTLFENGPAPHEYEPGDVNHDRTIDVSDVTALIAYVLGTSTDICPICAEVDGVDNVDVGDVTALIAIVLSKN